MFSPFTTAKAKVRRQKFALTKTTMNDSSDEEKPSTSASAQASSSTSYTAYDPPSPTIGGLVGVGNFIQGISPLALFNKTGSEPEPAVKVKAKGERAKDNDPNSRFLFWKLDEEAAIEQTNSAKRSLFKTTRLWKSFEAGQYGDTSHLWEPFCPPSPKREPKRKKPTKQPKPQLPPPIIPRTPKPPTRLDLFQIQNQAQPLFPPSEGSLCDKCTSGMYQAHKQKAVSGIPFNQPLFINVNTADYYRKPPKEVRLQRPLSEPFDKGVKKISSKSSTLPPTSEAYSPPAPKGLTIAAKNADKKRRFFAKTKQANSAPDTYTDMNSSTTSASSAASSAIQNVLEFPRRLCGNCKEPVTNCLDGILTRGRSDTSGDTTITPPSVEVWESEIRTARCGDVAVTHVSELDYPDADPPCHFCCEQASTAIHDESRLQIVSGGLVRSRDGSSRSGSAPYINLPSPNVQSEGAQPPFGSIDLSPSIASNLLSPGSHHHILPCPHRLSASSIGMGVIGVGGVAGLIGSGSTAPSSRGSSLAGPSRDEEPLVGPPASALTIRRPALVPPKLIPDADYENENDDDRDRNSDDMPFPGRKRRSSFVVIPTMQICPGDLLVYGKVLSQRKSLLGTPIEGPSPVPTVFEHDAQSRSKGKGSWNPLKLFGSNKNAKGTPTPTSTLEEIMGLTPSSDFNDPKLSRFKGMLWSDFVEQVQIHKQRRAEGLHSNDSSPGPSTSSSFADFKEFQRDTEIFPPQKPKIAPLPLKVSVKLAAVAAAAQSASPTKKPLLARKRIGLMRTMSDRCLERRAPALFRTQGFLASEKLVEGKESKTPGEEDEEEEEEDGGPSRKSSGNSQDMDPELRQRIRQREALWDLFQSECTFLYDHLMVLKNVFMEPMKRIQVEGFGMYAEPDLLFGNLDELCAVTYSFCKEFIYLVFTLLEPTGDLPTTTILAKLFEPSSKVRIVSQAYHRYALNYINALNYLETMRGSVEFCDFEKLCMKDPRCKKLQLTDLLVSPVQHLMKIPLLLKDIQSRTDEAQEKELIAQILEIQENSIRELDDKMKWLKNFERLLEIQRNIIWPSILEMEPKTWVPELLRVAMTRQPCDNIVVSPRRQIIHEGLLQLWDTGKPSECYIILFDDMLLITRRKKGLSKKKSSLTENWQSAVGKGTSVLTGGESGGNHRYIVYRQPVSLDRFFIHDIAEGESGSSKLEYAFVLVSLNRFQQIIAVHTFQSPSEQAKTTWLNKLKITQDKWKRTLQTTVFRGVRSSTDSGQSDDVGSSILGTAEGGQAAAAPPQARTCGPCASPAHGVRPALRRHNTCESSN